MLRRIEKCLCLVYYLSAQPLGLRRMSRAIYSMDRRREKRYGEELTQGYVFGVHTGQFVCLSSGYPYLNLFYQYSSVRCRQVYRRREVQQNQENFSFFLSLGTVQKKDVKKASIMREKGRPDLSVILAFNVKVKRSFSSLLHSLTEFLSIPLGVGLLSLSMGL